MIIQSGGMQRWQSCIEFGISPEASDIFQQQSNMLMLEFLHKSTAQFWTFCKREICSAGSPSKRELQQSSREVIMEETNLAVELRDRLERMDALFRRARKLTGSCY